VLDAIDHPALIDRVRRRVTDKRVLAVVKAFLKAGLLTELGHEEETRAGDRAAARWPGDRAAATAGR
jgi:hypothetical protein